jgi:hypothetical protein
MEAIMKRTDKYIRTAVSAVVLSFCGLSGTKAGVVTFSCPSDEFREGSKASITCNVKNSNPYQVIVTSVVAYDGVNTEGDTADTA